jgi:hypothetical protein
MAWASRDSRREPARSRIRTTLRATCASQGRTGPVASGGERITADQVSWTMSSASSRPWTSRAARARNQPASERRHSMLTVSLGGLMTVMIHAAAAGSVGKFSRRNERILAAPAEARRSDGGDSTHLATSSIALNGDKDIAGSRRPSRASISSSHAWRMTRCRRQSSSRDSGRAILQ